MSNRCQCLKLQPITLGFAIGVASGIFMMVLAWSSWLWDFGSAMVRQHAAVFPNYNASLNGGLYGLGYGILIGFVFGLVLGIIYNICLCCRSCKCCCCKKVNENSCKTV